MWVQKVPGGGVLAVAYAADGRTLYTLDTGGSLTAWSAGDRARRRLAQFGLDGWLYPRLHPLADGRLVLRSSRFVLLGPAGGVVAEADLTPGRFGYEQVRPCGRVYYLEPDRTSVSGWDLAASAPVPGFPVPAAVGPLSDPLSFDIAPDGRRVVVMFLRGGSGALFDLTEDRELRNPVPLEGVGGAYRARFSPDGRSLALFRTAPTGVDLWDVPTRAARARGIVCDQPESLFAFHPSAPVFAARDRDGVLTLFRLDTGDPIRSLDFALGRTVRCAAFSPDGLTCAVGGSNKQFAVFDLDL